MRKLAVLPMAALVAALVAAPFPALAAPQNTRVVEVVPCAGSGSDCEGDALETGDLVSGYIQVKVASSSSIGLEWLRVEGRLKGDSAWTCFQQWSGQVGSNPPTYATSMERDFRWASTAWPSASASGNGCSASNGGDGSRTVNGVYELRARAREATTGSTQPSSADTVHFRVSVANRAATPTWAKSPSVIDLGSRKMVELKWNTVADPDVLEYRFIRSGPDGQKVYAISAAQPGSNGCTGPKAPNQGVITCYDDQFDFGSPGYGGTYRYSLQSFRSTPQSGPNCSTVTKQPCIGSPVSEYQTASIEEPSPSPSPSTPGTSTPTTSPRSSPRGGGGSTPSNSPSSTSSPSRVLSSRNDSSEFYTGTYDDQLPYDSQRGFTSLPGSDPSSSPDAFDDQGTGQTLASGGNGFIDEPIDRRILTSIAAGLLMVLVAMHIARLLYER